MVSATRLLYITSIKSGLNVSLRTCIDEPLLIGRECLDDTESKHIKRQKREILKAVYYWHDQIVVQLDLPHNLQKKSILISICPTFRH